MYLRREDDTSGMHKYVPSVCGAEKKRNGLSANALVGAAELLLLIVFTASSLRHISAFL